MRAGQSFLLCVVAFGVGALGLAAACGTSGDDAASSAPDASRDASTRDVSPDSSVEDPGAGPVTVHATNSLGPVEGAVVVFYHPNGTVYPPMKTGADGTAVGLAAPGASVTISIATLDAPGSYNYYLTTYVGIEPGDDLQASTPWPEIGGVGSVTFEPPAGDGGSECDYSAGCGYAQDLTCSTATGTPIETSCIDGGTLSAFGWVMDGFAFAEYATATGVPFVDGGATVSGWTWNPTVSTPIALSGVPPVSIYGFLTFGITPRRGTLSFGQGIFTYAPQASDGGLSAPVSMGMPPAGGLIDNVIFLASADYPADGNHTACKAEIVDVQAVNDPLAVNYANLPPRIHDTALTYDETANTARIVWQEDGSESGLTGSLVGMGWEQFDDANLDYYSWVIYAPIGNAVTTPALTADLVGGFPTQDAMTNTGQPFAAEVGGDLFSTYAAFRQNAHPYTVQSAYPTTKGRFVMTMNGQ